MEKFREIYNIISLGKHEPVVSVDAWFKMVICKKFDAHDSKESTPFASRLKKN